MALTTNSFFNAVVALGGSEQDKPVRYVAAGFLYGHSIEKDYIGKQLYWVFLVTNRHVIENVRNLVIRFNGMDEVSVNPHPLPMGDSVQAHHCMTHPDSNINVAVLMIDAIDIVKTNTSDFNLDYLLADVHVTSKQEPHASRFREGNEIFVLGFPLGMVGNARNYVIVRQGIVARIQDWYENVSQSFLIDSSISTGNSGGLVIANPDFASFGRGTPIAYPKLIGMVSGYYPYENITSSSQTGRRVLVSQENSDLAVVVTH